MDSLLLVYGTTAVLALIPAVSSILLSTQVNTDRRAMNALSSLFFEPRAILRDAASW